MSLDTYSGLVAEVGEWLDRDDLGGKASTFIALAEARLNRLLEDPEQEVLLQEPATGEYTSLPDDFGSMVSISAGNSGLAAISSVEYAAIDHSITGYPRFYSLINNSIAFAPSNATTTIKIVYRRTIPALSPGNPSNWLLKRAPDVYLYGSLLQAAAYLVEDERLATWKAAYDEAVGELLIDGARRKWGAGPIASRVRRN